MRSPLPFLISTLLFTALVLAQQDPPDLLGVHQFYGNVQGLANGQVKAVVGTQDFTTSIDTEGQYGYAPLFKVSGQSGDTVVFYLVSAAGNETQVATASYVGGEVTRQDLSLPAESGPEMEPEQDDDNETDETIIPRRRSGSSNRTSDGSVGGVASDRCVQSWQCASWNACAGGQQTRDCNRIDNCDQLLANGTITNITTVTAPAEQQSCQGAPTPQQGASPTQICSPSAKRCLGQALQQCAADGTQWNALDYCTDGCDAQSLRCKTAAAKPISIPSWAYFLAGSVVLVIIIIVVGVSIYGRKKYAPAHEYIERSREKGFSDQQIATRLKGQGWNAQDINRLLK